ncbi:ferroxidase fet3, partial [Blyttiomyces sp. JEL0837]
MGGHRSNDNKNKRILTGAVATSALLVLSNLIQPVHSTTTAASTTPTTVTYHWTITNTTQRLDGVLRYALGINNNPGHQTAIEVNTGDTVVVKVTNGLNVPTSLHWH